MAWNPTNIHIGMGRIFLGVTPPATSVTPGAPPTKTPHTDGVPETGVEVGYTSEGSTFTYKAVKQEVEAEQSLNPVDVFITTEECTLEFTAMEHVYNTLKTAFDNVGSVDNATETMFYAGDSLGLVSVTTQCVVLTSRIRTAPTKFEVLTLYKVYNVEGVQIPYQRTGVAVYKISLKALVDSTRAAGDRLFQWYREKGGVTATGATAGTPGTFTPPGSVAPVNLAGLGPVTANPLTLWTVGQHVILLDTSHAHWNGTAWVTGNAPALGREGEAGPEQGGPGGPGGPVAPGGPGGPVGGPGGVVSRR